MPDSSETSGAAAIRAKARDLYAQARVERFNSRTFDGTRRQTVPVDKEGKPIDNRSPIEYSVSIRVVRDARGLRSAVSRIQDPDVTLYLSSFHASHQRPAGAPRSPLWRRNLKSFRGHDYFGDMTVLALYAVHKDERPFVIVPEMKHDARDRLIDPHNGRPLWHLKNVDPPALRAALASGAGAAFAGARSEGWGPDRVAVHNEPARNLGEVFLLDVAALGSKLWTGVGRPSPAPTEEPPSVGKSDQGRAGKEGELAVNNNRLRRGGLDAGPRMADAPAKKWQDKPKDGTSEEHSSVPSRQPRPDTATGDFIMSEADEADADAAATTTTTFNAPPTQALQSLGAILADPARLKVVWHVAPLARALHKQAGIKLCGALDLPTLRRIASSPPGRDGNAAPTQGARVIERALARDDIGLGNRERENIYAIMNEVRERAAASPDNVFVTSPRDNTILKYMSNNVKYLPAMHHLWRLAVDDATWIEAMLLSSGMARIAQREDKTELLALFLEMDKKVQKEVMAAVEDDETIVATWRRAAAAWCVEERKYHEVAADLFLPPTWRTTLYNRHVNRVIRETREKKRGGARPYVAANAMPWPLEMPLWLAKAARPGLEKLMADTAMPPKSRFRAIRGSDEVPRPVVRAWFQEGRQPWEPQGGRDDPRIDEVVEEELAKPSKGDTAVEDGGRARARVRGPSAVTVSDDGSVSTSSTDTAIFSTIFSGSSSFGSSSPGPSSPDSSSSSSSSSSLGTARPLLVLPEKTKLPPPRVKAGDQRARDPLATVTASHKRTPDLVGTSELTPAQRDSDARQRWLEKIRGDPREFWSERARLRRGADALDIKGARRVAAGISTLRPFRPERTPSSSGAKDAQPPPDLRKVFLRRALLGDPDIPFPAKPHRAHARGQIIPTRGAKGWSSPAPYEVHGNRRSASKGQRWPKTKNNESHGRGKR
jgi:hypothetical protein